MNQQTELFNQSSPGSEPDSKPQTDNRTRAKKLVGQKIITRDGLLQYWPRFYHSEIDNQKINNKEFNGLNQNGLEKNNQLNQENQHWYQQLVEQIQWQQPEIQLYGKRHRIPRLTAWYGDPHCHYQYSGINNQPLSWLPILQTIKQQIENHLQLPFNAVLLNWYQQGQHSMGWHADDEASLGPEPNIASLSLGATRRFRLRHRGDRQTLGIDLVDGSLLLMSGKLQQYWQHALPKTQRPMTGRINLTFRLIL